MVIILVEKFIYPFWSSSKNEEEADLLSGLLYIYKLVGYFLWYSFLFLSAGWWFATGDQMNCSTFTNCVPMCDGMFTGYCLMMSKFYQWVWCLLLVHCALAKIPGYLWQYLEGKRLEKLLHKGATVDNLAKFLTDHPNWYTRYEATCFFICQVLALMSSIVQVSGWMDDDVITRI